MIKITQAGLAIVIPTPRAENSFGEILVANAADFKTLFSLQVPASATSAVTLAVTAPVKLSGGGGGDDNEDGEGKTSIQSSDATHPTHPAHIHACSVDSSEKFLAVATESPLLLLYSL